MHRSQLDANPADGLTLWAANGGNGDLHIQANDDKPSGGGDATLTLKKIVVNDNSGTAVNTDFTIVVQWCGQWQWDGRGGLAITNKTVPWPVFYSL